MTDELKTALELIKRTCGEHFDRRPDFCDGCPLELRNDCFLKSNAPTDWGISELEAQT